jgi:hypothetical protein
MDTAGGFGGSAAGAGYRGFGGVTTGGGRGFDRLNLRVVMQGQPMGLRGGGFDRAQAPGVSTGSTSGVGGESKCGLALNRIKPPISGN